MLRATSQQILWEGNVTQAPPPADMKLQRSSRDASALPGRLAEWLATVLPEGAEDYLAAEVVYAVTHEGARHLDDVLTRRTRISIETFDRGTRSCEAA